MVDCKYNHDHARPRLGIHGPEPIGRIQINLRKIGNIGPIRTRNNAEFETLSRSRQTKIGPSGPRTKRSVDSCLERPFGHGHVEIFFDSKL